MAIDRANVLYVQVWEHALWSHGLQRATTRPSSGIEYESPESSKGVEHFFTEPVHSLVHAIGPDVGEVFR